MQSSFSNIFTVDRLKPSHDFMASVMIYINNSIAQIGLTRANVCVCVVWMWTVVAEHLLMKFTLTNSAINIPTHLNLLPYVWTACVRVFLCFRSCKPSSNRIFAKITSTKAQ